MDTWRVVYRKAYRRRDERKSMTVKIPNTRGNYMKVVAWMRVNHPNLNVLSADLMKLAR